jgi:alkylation response protein AidB-like acyl-CoA dehydrogenase
VAIGISEEHEELRRTARRWTESRCPPEVPRALLDADTETLPSFWSELASQGWLGIHVPESSGGQGFGLAELAVVIEEMGRVLAPGPFLPTVLAAALVDEAGQSDQRRRLLPGLVDGSTPAAVAFAGGGLEASQSGGGTLTLTGTLRPVLAAPLARLLVVPARVGDGAERWCVLDAEQVEVSAVPSLDPTRRVGSVAASGVVVPPDRQLVGLTTERVRDLSASLVAAECAGGLGWCVEVSSSYAKVREQFGRPIGQFQAVKHRLANDLVSLEQVTAAAWDASQTAGDPESDSARLSVAVAAALALDGYVEGAKDCIQVLGGIGFTWEHDAHMYLKRALSLRQLLGGTTGWRQEVAGLALGGVRRSLAGELLAAMPEDQATGHRRLVAPELEEVKAAGREQRRAKMVDLGYAAPHWPRPWGRGAGPVEQLVIDQEMARLKLHRPNLAIGAWALPTIIAYGTAEQQERFVRPTLLGQISWCQMFSEPGAGSDLASLSTKAVRVEGGWCLSGQKVWTSMARQADFAICLARTDPGAPKHEGITYFIVDMTSEGLDVRPLRELTGAAMFNEIFLSDVFVPDDRVIGQVNDGWRLARTTLANERVSMSSGSSFGGGVEGVLELLSDRPQRSDPVVLDRVGAVLAEAQSLALLGHRATMRTLSGVDPGPESSVRKLLGVEHEQRVQELGLDLLGAEGAATEGEAARWSFGFLANRCLTIAGGTSEVQRNLIAERLLGLPRDPEPGR